MKIDIVYTWVDGSDPEWNIKRKQVANKIGYVLPEANDNSRFMDNEELRFSLRSIYKYAPWVNNIFIVTDNQVPAWLQTEHPKINIIDHKEIFNDIFFLPTFNSIAIESQLHHIKQLSEHFIYFNDDMFLGREALPKHFFTKSGKPRVFVSEVIPIPKNKLFNAQLLPAHKLNDHQHAIINTRKLIKDRIDKSIYYNVRHVAKPMVKKILFELEEHFKNEVTETIRNNFRTNDDILFFHLFEYYVIAKKLGKTKYLKSAPTQKVNLRLGKYLSNDFTFRNINLHDTNLKEHLSQLKFNSPLLLCLNQTPKTPAKNLQLLKSFLNDYYPNVCPFEKDIITFRA